MDILGMILIFSGLIMGLIYGIKLIIIAFQESITWGLVYMFVPFACFYFIATRWDDCKKPFLMSLLTIPLMIGGSMLMPVAG